MTGVPQPTLPRFEPIETDRLVVRPVRASDVDALWLRRNDAETAAYQAWDVPYERSRAERLIEAVLALDATPPPDGWFQLMVDDRATGRNVGDLALHTTFAGRCAEIGYTVDAATRGTGVATEAAAALARWCFEVLGASRVSAQMHPDNVASIRVAEHIGMVFEGHTRNSFWVDRHDGGADNSDDWLYGMTPDSWRAWNERPRHAPATVQLTEIDHTNVLDALELETHRSQRAYVSPMDRSIAVAWQPGPHEGADVVPWPRLIEADGELVGFVMVAEPTDTMPEAYLWRLLIDRMHQRRGIGALVLDIVVEQARRWGAPHLDVSWAEGPGSPEPFYRRAGFRPTGEVEDDEIVARLEL
ncbi:MAG: GNAT family N-acetyltransferase [Actinomycetota bacterium]